MIAMGMRAMGERGDGTGRRPRYRRMLVAMLTVVALAVGVTAAVAVVKPQQAKAASVITSVADWPTGTYTPGFNGGAAGAIGDTVFPPFSMSAYVQSGEKFAWSMQYTRSVTLPASATVTIYSPSTVYSTCTIPAGTVRNPTLNLCSVNLTAPEAGVWSVNVRMNAPDTYIYFTWKMSVTSGSTVQPARLFTESLNLFQASWNWANPPSTLPPLYAASDIPLYVVNPQGYAYRATLYGFNGMGSVLAASNTGLVSSGTCIPAQVSSTFTNPGLGKDAVVPVKVTPDPNCGAFKMFLDSPIGQGLPSSAKRYNPATSSSYTDWLVQPSPMPPEMQNLKYVRTVNGSGPITYDLVNYQGGNVTLCVSLDAGATCTRTITQTVPASDGTKTQSMTYAFDGKDDTGNPIPPSKSIQIKATLDKAAEVHFVMGDVEVLSGGVEVVSLNGANAGSDLVYYNDTPFINTSSARCSLPTAATDIKGGNAQYDGRAGVHSTGGVHKWGAQTASGCTRTGTGIGTAANAGDGTNGGWGDNRNIDFWTFVPTPLSQTFDVPGSPLTVEKSAVPGSGSVLKPGDVVTYSVKVTNTGDIDYTTALPAAISDDLSKVLNEATYVTGSASAAPSGTPAPTVTGTALNWSGPLAAHGSVTLSYQVRVNSATQLVHTGLANDACITTTGQAGVCAPPVTHDIKALAIKKTVASSDTPAKVGSTLTYTVKVTNTGNVDYTSAAKATVTDDLSNVLPYADPSFGAGGVANITGGATMTGATALTWSGALAAGASTTFSYQVKIGVAGQTLTNVVTGPVESNCNSAGYQPNGSTGLAPKDNPDCSTTTSTGALVISKSAAKAGPLGPGDTQTFTITVTNNSDVDYTSANKAAISDDLSKVLGVGNNLAAITGTPSATIGGTATTAPTVSGTTLSWSGALASKASVQISYTVTIAKDASGWPAGSLVNRVSGPAESNCPATGTAPAACTTTTPLRALKLVKTSNPTGTAKPGDTVTYTITASAIGDGGYTSADKASFTDDLSGILDDASLQGSPSPATATISGSTLAWSDALTSKQSATITVTFKVNDPDTGDHQLVNTVVGGYNCPAGAKDTDCTPPPVNIPGLSISKTASVTSVAADGSVTYTVTVTNTGKVAYTTPTNPASFTDDLSKVLDKAASSNPVTGVSAGATFDAASKKLTWSGSLAVGATTSISYTVKVADAASLVGSDYVLVNQVTGPPEATCTTCTTTTPVRALKVDKQVSATTAGAGSVIKYTITVTNVGKADYAGASLASLTDDLSGVTNQAAYNGDVTASTGSASVTGTTLAWSGGLKATETATISYSVTVASPPVSPFRLVNSVDAPGSNCTKGASSIAGVACQQTTTVSTLTLVKTASTAGPVKPGDVVIYTIKATNNGQSAYTNASFNDDLANILDDATLVSGSPSADKGLVTMTSGTMMTWAGPLAVGETATITVQVTIKPADQLGDGVLGNTVVGGDNCTVGSKDSSCTPPPIGVKATLAAKTVVNPKAEYTPGDTITYQLTLKNTGSVDLSATDPLTQVSDDLSRVIDDASYNNDATASLNPAGTAATPSYTAPMLTWHGALMAKQTVTIRFSATINPADKLGDGVLGNAVVGGQCVDADATTPPCGVAPVIRALSILKTASTTSAVTPGQTISYTVRVTNTGAVDYTDTAKAVISDDMTRDLDTGMLVPGSITPASATLNPATGILSWSGALAHGASQVISYQVKVNDTAHLGDGNLTNVVTGPAESNCPAIAATPAPACATSNDVKAYSVTKTVAGPNPATPGQILTYTITVTNTGNVAYTAADPAWISDDLTSTFAGATLTGSITPAAATIDADHVLSWSGALAVKGKITITYQVTVNDAKTLKNSALVNTVVADPATNCAQGSLDPACGTVTDTRALLVKKTVVSPTTPTKAGSTLTYQIQITNTGSTAYTAADQARITDDLSKVLDDGQYVAGSVTVAPAGSPTAQVDTDAKQLTWSGPLAPAGVVVISYKVTINDVDHLGDGMVVNKVTGPAESNCATGSTDTDCATSTTVRGLIVSKTVDTSFAHQGADVTYTVTITNPGTVAYTTTDPASITDDLSKVLDDATFKTGSQTASAGTAQFTAATKTLDWSGPIPAGGQVTVSYTVTVKQPLTLGSASDGVLINQVTAPDSNCMKGSADPRCTTTTPVGVLQVTKSATPQVATVGQAVSYTITITNTGKAGYTAADPAWVSDDLSSVFAHAALVSGSVKASDNTTPAIDSNSVLHWSGPLAPAGVVTITYQAVVNQTTDLPDGTISNTVVSSPDSTCPPASNNPLCSSPVTLRMLHAAKTVDGPSPAKPGDTLTYTLQVTNTGDADYTTTNPAQATDDLTSLLQVATVDPASITGGAKLAGTSISWSGALKAHASVTVTFTATIKPASELTAGSVRNVVLTGPDGNCTPASADPDCGTVTPLVATRIVKTVTANTSPVQAGTVLSYQITISNVGDGDYTTTNPASLIDDLVKASDDATLDEASLTPASAQVSGDQISWSGPLAHGASQTISYKMTVHDPATIGDGQATNTVTGPASNCLTGQEAGCGTNTLVRSLRIVKTANTTGPLSPGDRIGYTLTITNTGAVDYTQAAPAVIHDDMTKDLDTASLVPGSINPSTATLDTSTGVLSWSGALAAKGQVQIRYTLQVNDTTHLGDGNLTNVVTGPPESNCPATATTPAPECATSHEVKAYRIVKTVTGPNPATPGDLLTYRITLINTGNVAYTDSDPARVSDDLTSVLAGASLVPGSLSPSTASIDNNQLAWSGGLPIGGQVVVSYQVTVKPATALANNTLVNRAVGDSTTNCPPGSTDPVCGTNTDTRALTIKKTVTGAASPAKPGSTLTYQIKVTNTGSVAYTTADQATITDDLSKVLDDGQYVTGSVSVSPAGSPAAQVDTAGKQLAWSGPLAVGGSVTISYKITINDTDHLGDGTLTNVVVGPNESNCASGSSDNDCGTTTTVRGLVVSKTADKTSVHQGGQVTYTITATNPGSVDYTDSDPATISDNLAGVVDDAAVDAASITASAGSAQLSTDGTTLTWSGPIASGGRVTISYTVTVKQPLTLGSTSDGVLTNQVSSPDSNCSKGSADSRCATITPVGVVEITKTATPQVATVGSTVSYQVKITNTGKADYTPSDPTSISDDLSSVLTHAALVPGSLTASDKSTPTIDSANVLRWSGPLAAGASVTVSYQAIVNQVTDLPDGTITNTVVGDGDSTCPEASVNPLCSSPVTLRMLHVAKTVDGPDPARPGDTLSYQIVVTNTGDGAYTVADPAAITDDLTKVLTVATIDPGSITGGAKLSGNSLSWSGALAAHASVTISYTATVKLEPQLAGTSAINRVITDSSGNCAPASTDPACGTTTPIKAITIVKTVASSTTPVLPGAVLTYQIRVTNVGDGDYTADSPASISDDLAKAADDATLVAGSLTPTEAQVTGGTISWSGPLASGATVTISYKMTVNQPSKLGDGMAVNSVTGPDSNCLTGQEADCTTTSPVRAVTIAKTATSVNSPARPGDVIGYTITVTNTGGVAYTTDQPLLVSDDLAKVLDDGQLVAGSVSPDGVKLTGTTLAYSGPLAVGGVLTISYKVQLNAADQLGDGELVNVVTGPGTTTTPESNCFDGSGDTSCTTDTLVRGLQVTKKASSDTATPGGKVSYTISITGTGKAPYTDADPAVVTDQMSRALDDASLDGDAKASSGKAVFDPAGKKLVWSGAIEPGQTITITYTLTINTATTLGDGSLVNTVTAPDSTCLTGKEDGCSTTTAVTALVVTKKASIGTALAGGTVKYTLTVRNVGGAPFTVKNPATFTDDMTKVLAFADFNNDLRVTAGAATFTTPRITWIGALPVGATAQVIYTVTVKPAASAGQMINVVAADASNCESGSKDSSCQATTKVVPVNLPGTGGNPPAGPAAPGPAGITPVTSPGLAFTGAGAAGIGAGALLLLLLGATLLAITRRKQGRE